VERPPVVKPPAFTYHRPESRAEVDSLLAELGPGAKILAGGQSLIPILNMRLANPEHIVDINHMAEEPEEPSLEDGWVKFGPLVRHEAVERSDAVAKMVPLLAEAIEYVAHPAIRSRGTVVGSIAHADPAAELPAVLVVLGGEVVARSASGTRTIAADRFFAGPLENSLEAGEWVEEVRWPELPGTGAAFEEFARRSGDYALCGVAAVARRDDAGHAHSSLCYLGMGDVPARRDIGPLGPEEDLEEAVSEALAGLEPGGDVHATADYRMHLAHRLGVRAVRRALDAVDAES
jgi:carbon-monoxide dehydrogenase medium subunit